MKGKDVNEDNKNISVEHTKGLGKAEDTLAALPFHNVCQQRCFSNQVGYPGLTQMAVC